MAQALGTGQTPGVTTLSAALLLLFACGVREIPEHLKPDAAPVAAPIPVVDLPTALAATLAGDPLARRPRAPDDALLATIPGAEPLRAFAALTRAAPDDPAAWSAFERERRGSLAVGLARGWRLGAVESMIGPLTQGDEAAARAALLWLSGLRDAPTLTVAYSPWFFVADPVTPEQMRAMGERWALRGFLDGPGVPVDELARLLQSSTYDRLTGEIEGQILLSRAAAPRPAPPADLTALQQLIGLCLERATADTDKEQAAHRERVMSLPGATGADPLPAYARDVAQALAAQAGDDEGAGGALLAAGLARWLVTSPEALDRADTLATAGRFSPRLKLWADVALTATLKDAVDRLEVGLKHQRFAEALPRLADALIGLGLPVDISLLERRAPIHGAWLSITRAAGRPDGTTQDEGLAALRGLNHARLTALAASPNLPADWAPWIARAQRRAAP